MDSMKQKSIPSDAAVDVLGKIAEEQHRVQNDAKKHSASTQRVEFRIARGCAWLSPHCQILA